MGLLATSCRLVSPVPARGDHIPRGCWGGGRWHPAHPAQVYNPLHLACSVEPLPFVSSLDTNLLGFRSHEAVHRYFCAYPDEVRMTALHQTNALFLTDRAQPSTSKKVLTVIAA